MMVILGRHALYFIFILVCFVKFKLIKGANKVVVVVVVFISALGGR